MIPNKYRCNDTLPPGSRIVIGWELPNQLPRKQAYYFYGSGSVDPNKILKGWKDDYNLSVTIDSLLPKQVLWFNADSSQALAVGHIFLTNTPSLKNGDTLLYTELIYTDILAGLGKNVVVYQKGHPLLLGKPLGDTIPEGFSYLRGYKNIFGPSDQNDMKATYLNSPTQNSPSPFVFLWIDDKIYDTQEKNPMWLP